MPITNIITATITAYCACKVCCGPNAKGITASGHTPIEGTTIAAPRTIPFGSKVIINGHTYSVQDRLSKRFPDRFDVFMSSHKRALIHGIKTNQTITIITTK